MSFIVLAVLVGLFVYLNHLDDRNPAKDPGYGAEHMGAYLSLGLLGMTIAGLLIYMFFTDLLGFLAAAGGVLIVFLCSIDAGVLPKGEHLYEVFSNVSYEDATNDAVRTERWGWIEPLAKFREFRG